MAKTILELRKISQFFPGIKALDGVDFCLKEGEIHALIGENGAGKSTLVKILTGINHPTTGEFLLYDKPVHFTSPTESQEAGIAAIHQEAVMFPDLTVNENIWMGHQIYFKNIRVLNHRAMKKKTKEILNQLDMKIDLNTLVRDLSVAERHMVEIAKALSMDAKIVIMDEPTSALSIKEVDELFKIINQLKSAGKTLIFISHKFEEIFSICDSYTVFRDGKLIGTGAIKDVDTAELVSMMVGRKIDQLFPKEHAEIGDKILEVNELGKNGIFKDISFDLHKGEILGFFGLVGSGRSDVMNALVGIYPADEGAIHIKDKTIQLKSIQDAIKHHIGYVPEDRQNQGAIIKFSIRENITLPQIDKLSRLGFINTSKEQNLTADFGKRFEIKATSYEQKVLSLSGGNQQKVILAKWLATNPEILILDEPTKGIDIATKWAVYQYIIAMAKQGMAIILVSSELPEILGLSDQIVVMHEGRITGNFSRSSANSEDIMHAAISTKRESRISEGVQP